MPTVLIVQPAADDPPERLEAWLEAEGLELRIVRPYAGEAVPAELAEDALVVLGGDMGATDVDAYPWLGEVMALLRLAVGAGSPTLGVCLGSQLMAAALGGRVEPGEAGMETGVVEVRARTEAADDALLGDLAWPLRMTTMHRDAITVLPSGAVWLAESEPYGHQAFRIGDAAWGVQFHPEVSPATYAGWAEHLVDDEECVGRAAAGVSDVERDDPAIAVGAEALIRRFAGIVHGGGRTESGRLGR